MAGLSQNLKFRLSIPQKPIILTFFLNLFNYLAFAYRVVKLKLFASISATDAKPRNVIAQCKKTNPNRKTEIKK